MRTLIDISAGMIGGVGVILLLLALTFLDRGGPSGFVLLLSVAAFIFAFVIHSACNHATCPQCAEKIKAAAVTCKHCGHQIRA